MALFFQGLRAYNVGDISQSVKLLNQARRLDPDSKLIGSTLERVRKDLKGPQAHPRR